MVKSSKLFELVLLICLLANNAQAKDLNPIDYGLKECHTGVDRYQAIYNCHVDALKKDLGVCYKGIDTIYIVIPPEAKGIPLCKRNDFSNCVFVVKNNERKIPLFTLSNQLVDCDEEWHLLMKTGETKDKSNQLIVIEDIIPWVKERKGYGYGHTRKDILFVKEGILQNNTIANYDNYKPRLYKSIIQNCETKIENLTFIRDSSSSRITFLFKIENQYGIVLNNITTKTPNSDLFEDAIIRMDNCYKVTILNTTIEGTYSQRNKYGYGICLLNVGDVYIRNLKANGNWGVFGNNNVNKIKLIDCDINRFDIHCYGRDVYFNNCIFRGLYNQFSSIYGSIVFERCSFINFIPVLFESSYNAYTGFDLYINNCIWNVTTSKNYLISAGNPCYYPNPRKELSDKCWPNINISNLKILISEDVNDIFLFKVKNGCDVVPHISYMKDISLSDIVFQCPNETISFFLVNEPIKFDNSICIKIVEDNTIVEDIKIRNIDKNHILPHINNKQNDK